MKDIIRWSALVLAGLASATAINPIERRDVAYYYTEYDVERPAGSGYETCGDDYCDAGKWRAIQPDEGGQSICGDYSLNREGYRIAGQADTDVIYKCNDSIQPLSQLSYNTSDYYPMSIFWTHLISQTWSNTTHSPISPFSTNGSSVFRPLAFTDSIISAENVDCDTGLPLCIETTDAFGLKQYVQGNDSISIAVPAALPAKVRFSVVGKNSTADLVIDGKEKILVAEGSSGPVVSANYNLQMQVCPD